MMKGKNLSNIAFWTEAISTAVYLKNISPTRCLDLKIPFEALYGFKSSIYHMREFFSRYVAHIPKENRKKLDAKAIKCIFVGYCSDLKAHKIFNPSTHRVFQSKDVIFHEKVDEGNKDRSYEEWHKPLVMDDIND